MLVSSYSTVRSGTLTWREWGLCAMPWPSLSLSTTINAALFFQSSNMWMDLRIDRMQTKLVNVHMMTSSNGNIFRVTGHMCRKFTSHRWISRTKASGAELWCFLWSTPEWTVEQTIMELVIWDAIAPIMTSQQYRSCRKPLSPSVSRQFAQGIFKCMYIIHEWKF